LEKLNRALAIRVKKLGRHCDTADTYMNIGHVFQEQGNDEKAEEIVRKALDISLEILPSTDLK
jgi:Tfp pilus assembly protein PilF